MLLQLARLLRFQCQVTLVKNTPASAGDTSDVESIPGSGRYPGGGNGNPFQYSWLENPMDRGAWWATVHGVAKSQTQQQFSMHARFQWLHGVCIHL